MDDIKLKDRYDTFIGDSLDELEAAPPTYADGYLDGAYAFFADLLGEPSA